jgi:hypothetical protein
MGIILKGCSMGFNKKEKNELEKLFDMHTGYVLDFSNRTFESFVLDSVGIDIYEEKYKKLGTSKAKLLRAFWETESDHNIAQLTNDLIDRRIEILEREKSYKIDFDDEYEMINQQINKCRQIVDSLESNEVIDAFNDLNRCDIKGSDAELLLKDIKKNVDNNDLELVLDRLHTYSVKYFRGLCDKHNISYDRSKPLNQVANQYIAFLNSNKYLESEMSKTIMRNSVSLLHKYNEVRNNKTFAHDNEILNFSESKLIYLSMTSMLSFVSSIESKIIKDGETTL